MMIPSTRIQEGENLFLLSGPGEPLQRGLPPSVFLRMKDLFEAAHPKEQWCKKDRYGCWVFFGVPKHTFAPDAEGFLWHPRWSRIVTQINFKNIQELRLGTINDIQYNWFDDAKPGSGKNLSRAEAPFFVAYQIPANLVDSQLCWTGEVLWTNGVARFDSIIHQHSECRNLKASDIGNVVYGLSISPDRPLAMRLVKSERLHFADDLLLLVKIVTAILITGMTAKPRMNVFVPLILAAAGYWSVSVWGPALLSGFPVFQGGNDGLTHTGFGRLILEHIKTGNMSLALRGEESIFYFMPGLRYLRAVEMLVFGDTNFGYASICMLLPFFLFELLRALRWKPAVCYIVVCFFAAGVLGGPFGASIREYIIFAAQGFPDTMGYALMIISMAIMLQQNNGRAPVPLVGAGFLLAWAVFVRPNLALGAGIFLLIVASHWFVKRQYSCIIQTAAGFAPILLVPFHNLYFGGRLVLLTSAAFIPENLLASPRTYWYAGLWLFGLGGDKENFSIASDQIKHWLTGPMQGGLPDAASILAHLFVICVTLVVAFSPKRWGDAASLEMKSLAGAALGLQPMLIFFHPDSRYALLAWLLSAIVSAGLIAAGAARVFKYIAARRPDSTFGYIKGSP
jgi:hypothetical protein